VQEKLALMMKALGHPHRLQLFALLRSQQLCCYVANPPAAGELGCCVGDLQRECGFKASTLSHHLKELRTAGLVVTERQGQLILCRVNESALNELRMFLADPPPDVVDCAGSGLPAASAPQDHAPQSTKRGT
jgi:DNA-binding transcriptional ArsR family regulator